MGLGLGCKSLFGGLNQEKGSSMDLGLGCKSLFGGLNQEKGSSIDLGLGRKVRTKVPTTCDGEFLRLPDPGLI